MKLLTNCIRLVSSIRPASPSLLAIDIGTLRNVRGPLLSILVGVTDVRATCYKEPQTCSQETSSLEAGMEHGAVSHAFYIELVGGRVWAFCLFACFILYWVAGTEFVLSVGTN